MFIAQFIVLPINGDGSSRRRRLQSGDDSDTQVDLSQSIFIGSNYTSVDKIRSQSCYDGSCISCNINNRKVCCECHDTYECERIINSSFVEGGYETLLHYSYSYSGVTGGNSTAMIFDGYTKLDLSPLDLDEEVNVTNFKISFRFKPYAISYDRLISIDNDNVEIILPDNSANYINSDVNAQHLGLFKVVNNTWSSNVGEGTTVGEWNTIVEYLHDAFTIYITDATTKVACFANFANADVALQFNEWYIGGGKSGINGELDQLILRQAKTICRPQTSSSVGNGNGSGNVFVCSPVTPDSPESHEGSSESPDATPDPSTPMSSGASPDSQYNVTLSPDTGE